MPDVFTFRLNRNVLKLSAKLHKSFPVHNFMLKIFVHAPENLLIIRGLIGRSASQFPRFIPYICRFYLFSNCLTDSIFFSDDKTELFNPNCRNCLLLSNIKERCDCEDDGEKRVFFFLKL